MKKILFVLFFLTSFVSVAQKAKLKKDKVLIDNVEVYSFTKEGTMTTLSTLSKVEFVSIVTTSYQEKNRFYDPKYSSSQEYLVLYVHTVKFLKSGKELTTDLDLKRLSAAIYNSNLVDENGNVDEVKLETFITKYNNENLKLKIN